MNLTTGSSNGMAPERRGDYRIHYPAGLRPCMWLGDCRYEVLDVSEQGLCFGVPPGACKIQLGETVRVRLELLAGRQEVISGHVVRVQQGAVAARLTDGPGFKVIAREFEWVMEHSAGATMLSVGGKKAPVGPSPQS